MLPLQKVCIQTLIRKLRSHKPCGVAKKLFLKKCVLSSSGLQFSVLVSIILINLCSFFLHFPIVFSFCLLSFSADSAFSIDLFQVFLFYFFH